MGELIPWPHTKMLFFALERAATLDKIYRLRNRRTASE